MTKAFIDAGTLKDISFQKMILIFLVIFPYSLIIMKNIIGFSMDLSEFDLWWLVCCKKRHFSNSKIYFYEPVWKKNGNSHNKILMEIYGVEICYIDCKENDFKDFYLRFIEKFSSHNL